MGLARIKRDIETVTGIATDILTPLALPERFRQAVLDEAVQIRNSTEPYHAQHLD
jgi:predicted nucleotidyltransferase